MAVTYHRPKRSLGQNFLRDQSVIDRIVSALDLNADDHVIEIGPGQGALTERLVAEAGHVTGIDFDRDLVAGLRERFVGRPFTVLEADALTVDLRTIEPGANGLKLVGNLPYNISTPILQRFIDQRELFSVCVLMFQREVADRIAAVPGIKARGYLSVLAQNGFEVERLFDVPPTAFYPVPKVWSSVLRLIPKTGAAADELFTSLVSSGFRQKRKTLANNLAGIVPDVTHLLNCAGLPLKCRAEELTLDDWRRLTDAVRAHGNATGTT
jgi:16S rRNA (adenine1518-N6/adenine1519-N6)-dimethyltransferase